MGKRVTIVLDFTDEDYKEFVEETCHGQLYEWIFAELCQNQDMGFLTRLHVEEIDYD